MSSANNNNNTNQDESIAGKIQCIQKLCAYPNHAQAATGLLSDRLMAMCQVLAAISEPINTTNGGEAVKGLYSTLTRLEECLVQILSMNRVVYMVQALNLQTDLESLMQKVSSHLQILVKSLSPAGQGPLQAPLSEYQKLVGQHQRPFRILREKLQQEQSRLALCASDKDFETFYIEAIGHISEEELSQALTVLQQELGVLSVKLSKSNNDDENDNKSNQTVFIDAAARGKAIQYQGLLGIVVARLQAHPKLQQQIPQQKQSTNSKEPGSGGKDNITTAEYPSWALDPLTGALMTTPVKLRAPCQHIMDKATFIKWMDKGETKCPVCQGPMTSIAAKADKGLKKRIQQAVLKSHKSSKANASTNSHSMEFAILEDGSAYQTIRPERDAMRKYKNRSYSSMDSNSSLAGMSIQEDKAHDTFDESREKGVMRDLDSSTTQKNILSELRKVITDAPSPSSPRRKCPSRFIVGSDVEKMTSSFGGGEKTKTGPLRVLVPSIDATIGGRKAMPPSSPRSGATVTIGKTTTSANNKNSKSSQQKIRLVHAEVIQLSAPKSGTTPKFFDTLRRKLSR